MWEVTEEEVLTLTIEITTIFAGLFVIFIILFLRKQYPKFTQKGFLEFILGVLIFTFHFVFDALDTLVSKDLARELYDAFDILDAVFAFSGLFIIGFAFYRIANFGMELWEGNQ